MIKQSIISVLTILFWCSLKFNAQTIQSLFPSLANQKLKFDFFLARYQYKKQCIYLIHKTYLIIFVPQI